MSKKISKRNYYINANQERYKYIKEMKITDPLIHDYTDADKRIPINRPLYEDYLNYVLKKSVKEIGWKLEADERRYKLYFETEKKYLFTMDYIGPSRQWANKKANIYEKLKFEAEILSQSRVLAGHIIWPTYNKKVTTNQDRGGFGFYDRIDVTLKILQIYMDKKIYLNDAMLEEDMYNVLKEMLDVDKISDKVITVFKSFHRYSEFYKEIKTFKKFCDINMLLGSFVLDQGKQLVVVNLQPTSQLIPVSKPTDEYTKNNLKCIEIRQKIIFNA